MAMNFLKDWIIQYQNKFSVGGVETTIDRITGTVSQEGDTIMASYLNEIQKNCIYQVNATRVIEGTVEFYDIAIEGSDVFDVFNTQFIINFNETNTKLNPVLRFNGNNYYIRMIESFIDVDVAIGTLQKTYIGFLDSTNNKLKLFRNERKLTFDTMAEAQAFDGFKEGDIVQVLGYHEKADGKGHRRIISLTDDGSGIRISNFWLIIYEEILKPIYFGFDEKRWEWNIEYMSGYGDIKPYKNDMFFYILPGKVNLYLTVNIESIETEIIEKNNYLYSLYSAKLFNNLYPDSLGFNFFGDSTTYGMGSEVIKTGTQTNFGDGSTYANDQVSRPYPTSFGNEISSIYTAKTFVINNFGFSGDRSSNGYFRHTNDNTTNGFSLINYGINDFLYSTSNGLYIENITDETNRYSIKNFKRYITLWISREVLRGNCPILIAPYNFFTTNNSVSSYLEEYINCIKDVSKKFNVYCVELSLFLKGIPRTNVHCDSDTYDIIGNRLVSLFIGRGHKEITNLKLGFNTALTLYTSSLYKNRSTTATKWVDYLGTSQLDSNYSVMLISDNRNVYSFYSEYDDVYIIPLLFSSNPSSDVVFYVNGNTTLRPYREFIYNLDEKKTLIQQLQMTGVFTTTKDSLKYIELKKGLNNIKIINNGTNSCFLLGWFVKQNVEFSLIPEMTSTTTPRGTVEGTGEFIGNDYKMYKIFDKSNSEYYTFANNTLPYIQYVNSTDNTYFIKGYKIHYYSDNITQAPKSFEVYYMDKNNNWILIDTQTNLTWSTNETKYFNLSSKINAKGIKLQVTKLNGSTYGRLAEFDVY